MSDDTIEKGDIVKSPIGFFVKVNWVKNGDLGASSIDDPDAGMVYKVSECTLVRKHADSFFSDILSMSDDELKQTVISSRERRTILPTPEVKVERKRDMLNKVLKELSQEELNELEEFVKLKEKEVKSNA